MDNVKNFAKATVSGGFSDTATSINVITGHGVKFPTVPFNAVWYNSTDFPDPADDPDREIIRVTARDTDALTITRAQEGTPASFHDVEGKLYKLIAGLTAKVFNDDLKPFRKSGTSVFVDSEAGTVSLGDVEVFGNGNYFTLDDSSGNAQFVISGKVTMPAVLVQGQIQSDQTAAASVGVGTIARKLEIFDADGVSLGFIPIYASIT